MLMKQKRLLLLLALLMTVATGAWAQQVLKVKPITQEMATPWTEDDGTTLLTPDHLPGFCPATEEEAKQWADVPQEGVAILIYHIDDPDDPEASSNVSYVWFVNGRYSQSVSQTECPISSLTEPILNQGVKFFYTWAPTYTVKLADGTKDADNWTIAPAKATDPEFGVAKGKPVTLTYGGRLKVKNVTATTDAGPGPLATPLTIEAITAGSIIVANPKVGMQYSLDGGKTKNAVTTDEIALNAGDKVQFYGDDTNITSYGSNAMSECTMINGSGEGFTCKVYGNIMSLLDEKNFATATTLSASYTFKSLFYNNPTLTDASGLLLPATQLQESCYRSMFSGCEALTAAPALPAMQLAAHCYREMFNGCSVLTAAPVLPATKLVMYCYFAMFNYCENLATVTCLATSGINQDSSTYYWLYGAGSQFEGTKTVNTFSTAEWPVDNNSGIPTDWTRVNIDN